MATTLLILFVFGLAEIGRILLQTLLLWLGARWVKIPPTLVVGIIRLEVHRPGHGKNLTIPTASVGDF